MSDPLPAGVPADLPWLDVDVEPHHVEFFRNGVVRLYEATIAPGTATQFHRHALDTVYVVTSGGAFRSDEPGRQHPGTRLGRSVSPLRRVALLTRRVFTQGWLRMPAGTVIIQPHRTRPLIHQVEASGRNREPVRMIGVELRVPTQPIRIRGRGLRLEHSGAPATVYRLSQGAAVTAARGAAIVCPTGAATARKQHTSQTVPPGRAAYLEPGNWTIDCPADTILIAL